MGVPAFYRWLSQRYPKIVKDCIEEVPEYIDGVEVPVDVSQPNPNGMEFDNLYLDMNGIIHPCFHPEDRPPPTTEREMFLIMFDYIDRLFCIVRPRRLLYMAIDGVAPRAKMNQQRSRRFRAAQEAEEKEKHEEELRQEFASQGIRIPRKDPTSVWDSNTITPGTAFMHRLSIALQYYVHQRLNSEAGWRNITVILSDANVPGEGEHKIMAYIRQQRGRPGWEPNLRHCLYGLDADLIMLALATHEPRFVILREVVFAPQNQGRQLVEQVQAQLLARNNPEAPEPEREAKEVKKEVERKPYQFVLASVLREYLALDMQQETPFPWDSERAYDDFVFMCFFCGNDFLPHMPTLDIREGAIELLMAVYKEQLPHIGWLTQGAQVLLDRVERFVSAVGGYEDRIFQKRSRLLKRDKGRRERDKGRTPPQKGRKRGVWGSNAPSAEYTASLQPIARPDGSRGPVILAPPTNAPQPQLLRERLAGEKAKREAAQSTEDGVSKRPKVDLEATADAAGSKAEPDADGQAKQNGHVEDGAQQQSDAPADAAAYWAKLEGIQPANGSSGQAASGNPQATDSTPHTPTPPAATANGVAAASSGADAPADSAMAEPPSLDQAAAQTLESEPGQAPSLAANGQAAERQIRDGAEKDTEEFSEAMKEAMKGRSDMFDDMFTAEEKIRLGEPGWKARYYQEKLGLPEHQQGPVVRNMVHAFVEGLCWVMRYYYEGVPSWTWYYPFHYAPFASDLINLSSLDITFEPGEPFKPFNQLMGVLPAASAHALPQPMQPLFTSIESPILDFYPTNFAIDMNGKRFAWQAVVLLPFIEEERLLSATAEVEHLLTEEERRRNSRRLDQIYMLSSHPMAPDAFELADSASEMDESARTQLSKALEPTITGGMSGLLLPASGEACPAVLPAPFSVGDDITANAVCCASFKDPPEQKHVTRPLPGQMHEDPVLTEEDQPQLKALWHEDRPGFGGGQELGPRARLDPAAHRMLNHSLAGAGGAPPGQWGGPHAPAPVGYHQHHMHQQGFAPPMHFQHPQGHKAFAPPFQQPQPPPHPHFPARPGWERPSMQYSRPPPAAAAGGFNPYAPAFHPGGVPPPARPVPGHWQQPAMGGQAAVFCFKVSSWSQANSFLSPFSKQLHLERATAIDSDSSLKSLTEAL
ncbi:hypothetical protein WJX73_003377 [Symbiochloris irregularis]|uniref:5'-3' exoribonuclease n=1 Tax=Symbiochloris irregularis TaxID=706552 RepID=A0AAW1PF15_9CHLO